MNQDDSSSSISGGSTRGSWRTEDLQGIKRTLLQVRQGGLESALKVEAATMAAQVGTPENQEAIAAFRERRPPDFNRLFHTNATGAKPVGRNRNNGKRALTEPF